MKIRPPPCLHTFTRQAYYGGRVEVFREKYDSPHLEGHHPIPLNYADVNSMYPWAMLGPVPTELQTKQRHDSLGFIDATVEIDSSYYLPPLPYRQKGKLIFPTGVFRGVWTTEELACLEQLNGAAGVKIHEEVWFRGETIFADYVHHWYRYRDKNAPGYSIAMDMIAKLFLTSLYGKFGMNPERQKLWFFPTDEQLSEHNLIPFSSPEFGAHIEKTISDPPYVIPHIAAWVTSRSRARLWTMMNSFLRAGYRIYYCDTDSIVTDAPIQHSTELGQLKLECQVKRARFVAPKLYFIERADGSQFVKAKGFSGGFGAKGLTETEFNALVEHTGKVKVQRMRKLKEGMRDRQRFPSMVRGEKGTREGLLDEKRIHLPDGNTKPVLVLELD